MLVHWLGLEKVKFERGKEWSLTSFIISVLKHTTKTVLVYGNFFANNFYNIWKLGF